MSNIMWDNQEEVTDLGFELPSWIESLSPYDMAGIYQGGCASGAYMPAVTYWQALETMSAHADDVIEYLEGEEPEFIPQLIPAEDTWSGYCVKLLSFAVELWVSDNYEAVEAKLNEGE